MTLFLNYIISSLPDKIKISYFCS